MAPFQKKNSPHKSGHAEEERIAVRHRLKLRKVWRFCFEIARWSFLSLEIGRENQNNYQSKVGGSYLKVRSVEVVEILRNLYPFCLKHTIVQVDNFPEQRQIDLGNQIKFSKFH